MGIIRTFYFVIPFVVSAGSIVPIEAFQCKSAEQAVKRAQLLSEIRGVVGAAAFSRIGDLEAGVFDDAVTIKTYGEVPEQQPQNEDRGLETERAASPSIENSSERNSSE